MRNLFIRLCQRLGSMVILLLAAQTSDEARACEPLPAGALQQSLEEADRALSRLRTEEAYTVLSDVVQRLPCLSTPAGAQSLAHLYLRLGVVRSMTGDALGAREAFEQALVFHPGLPWNTVYGHFGETLFEEAREQARCARCSQLRLPRLRQAAEVTVDGVLVPSQARQLALVPGRHLVLVSVRGEVRWGGWVETHSGRTTYLEPNHATGPQGDQASSEPAGSLWTLSMGLMSRADRMVPVEAEEGSRWVVGGGLRAGVSLPLSRTTLLEGDLGLLASTRTDASWERGLGLRLWTAWGSLESGAGIRLLQAAATTQARGELAVRWGQALSGGARLEAEVSVGMGVQDAGRVFSPGFSLGWRQAWK